MRITPPWVRADFLPGYDAAVNALSRISTPEVVLPGQDRYPRPDESPPTRLRQWILLTAISDFIEGSEPSSDPKIARERRHNRSVAESWFDGDEGALISFADCAAAFGRSADEMRARIARLSRRAHRHGERWL